MKKFDVVIAGAGPAGGQCARRLAAGGKSVLLLEKAPSFAANNYSSGGAPLQVMQDFSLPGSIVGAYWNRIAIHTTNNSHTWTSPEQRGVVFDFMKLREHLSREAAALGASVWLNHAYIGHDRVNGCIQVHVRNQQTRQVSTCLAGRLVDATGCERQVIEGKGYDAARALTATGIEHVVAVNESVHRQYAGALTFFLGTKWMPQGYGWIFPMDSGRLKVGVIRYFPKEHLCPGTLSYKHYLDALIAERIGSPQVLERHGKTLTYTWGQRDNLGTAEILGTGDAVSMLNPLASEGIRHALYSGQAAADTILSGGTARSYAAALRGYCGYRWRACEWLLSRYYRQTDDEATEVFLRNLHRLTFDQLLDLAFNYKLTLGAAFYTRFSAEILLRRLNLIA